MFCTSAPAMTPNPSIEGTSYGLRPPPPPSCQTLGVFKQHRAKTKHLAARAFREWSVAKFRVCGCSRESAAKSSFVAIRSVEAISWHPGNSYSYSLAMQTQEAFLTETPNPSFKRTGTGRPALGFISFWAKPALPPRAAHVKR